MIKVHKMLNLETCLTYRRIPPNMQCQVCSILKDKPGEKKLWVFPTSTTLNLKTTGLGFKEYWIEFSIKSP